jgi:glycosyltransferase involved in cell wall biosynthesis
MIEHLIGDGNSSDGTKEKILLYKNLYDWVEVDFNPGKNIPSTLNQILKKSKGKLISVLNGDDYYEIEEISLLLNEIKLNYNENIIYCGDINLIKKNGDYLGLRTCDVKQIVNYMSVNHPGMIVPKLIFDKFGYFNQSSKYNYDYAWTWLMHRNGVKFKHYQRPVAVLRSGGISESACYKAAAEIALIKIKSGNSWSAVKNYGLFITKYFIKKILPKQILSHITRIYRKIFKSVDPVDAR